MFCTNCGRKLPDNIKFCPYCGTKTGFEELLAEKAQAAAPAPEPEPVIRPAAAEPEPVIKTAAEPAAYEAPKAETAAPAAEPVRTEEPAKAAPTKKKKTPIALIALLLVAALGGGGFWYSQNTPAAKLNKVLKEASSLLDQKQYSSAIGKYDEALELDPENAETVKLKIEALRSYALNMAEQADDDTALDLFTQAAGLISKLPDENERNAQFDGISEDIYSIAELYVNAGVYEKAIDLLEKEKDVHPFLLESAYSEQIPIYQQWIDELLAKGDEKEISAMKNKLEFMVNDPYYAELKPYYTKLAESGKRAEYALLLQNAVEMIRGEISGDNNLGIIGIYAASYVFSNYGYCQELAAYIKEDPAARSPFITMIEGNSGAGLYYDEASSTYYLYVGEYSGAQRSGKGTWITVATSGTSRLDYVSDSSWTNDKPNGDSTVTVVYYTDNKVQWIRTLTGKTKDGIFDGDVTYDYGENIYHVKMENGQQVVIDKVNPTGEETNVIAYNEDKTRWINQSNSRLLIGIIPFSD